MENNFPCVCGHPKNMHHDPLFGGLPDSATCMISNESRMAHSCIYHPDNLRYLEKEYVRHN